MGGPKCPCKRGAYKFHTSQNDDHCNHINQWYTPEREHSEASKQFFYQYFRCLQHTHEEATSKSEYYHEVDERGSFIHSIKGAKCSYVHFLSEDIVRNANGKVSLSRITSDKRTFPNGRCFGYNTPTVIHDSFAFDRP